MSGIYCAFPTGEQRLIDCERLIHAKDKTDLCAVLYAEVRRIRDEYKDLPANGHMFDNLRHDLECLCKSVTRYLENHGTKINPFECVGGELKPVSFKTYLYPAVMQAIDAAMHILDYDESGIVYPVRIDRFVYAYFKGIGNE